MIYFDEPLYLLIFATTIFFLQFYIECFGNDDNAQSLINVVSDKFHLNYHQDTGMKIKVGLQNISVFENKTRGL